MTAVHWPLAARVAGRLAGQHLLEGSYHFSLLARQAPGLVARAAEAASEETRLPWVGQPRVAVVTRADWARANIGTFEQLLSSLDTHSVGRAAGLGRSLQSRLAAAEMGALVGVLARRVLGQYELVVPSEGGGSGSVMLVGANILSIERDQEFRPAEFRYWVALHECTHRLQFGGVPWLRGHFLGLVSRLVETSAPEPGRLQRLAGEMRAAARAGRPVMDETGLVGLLATPGQRHLIEEVQALMSLLEGHGHVVMDRIGARELVGQDRMSRVLRMRRKDPRMAAFLRLTGLEMKMKQYEMGERFVLAVEGEAGFGAIDRAWEKPQNLPTLAEIEDPQKWLQRTS